MSELSKKFLYGAAVAGVAVVLATASAVGASADGGLGEAPEGDAPEVVTEPMGVTGFDARVAAEHGYEIRTTAEGRLYSVPIGTRPDFVPNYEDTIPGPDGLSAQDVRTSNCGTSKIWVDDYAFETGYTTKEFGVVYAKWGVTVSSPGAFQDFNLDHGPTTTWWNYTGLVSSAHKGAGGATINPLSHVMLSNGSICQSLQARDFHTFN